MPTRAEYLKVARKKYKDRMRIEGKCRCGRERLPGMYRCQVCNDAHNENMKKTRLAYEGRVCPGCARPMPDDWRRKRCPVCIDPRSFNPFAGG